ncbi:hypothetical protein FWK35_00021455, partial [Aphis craccivora]
TYPGAIINFFASNAVKITPLVTARILMMLSHRGTKKSYFKRRSASKTNKAENNRPPVPSAANISIEPPLIKLKNYTKLTKNHNNI